MNKKDRRRALQHSDFAMFVDGATWVIGTGYCWLVIVVSTLNNDDLDWGIFAALCVIPIFVCLIRIRMVLRATRIDALLREEEEEARREATATTPHTPAPPRQSMEYTCPGCHIPVAIPTTYPHNVAKCPHCTGAIPLR